MPDTGRENEIAQAEQVAMPKLQNSHNESHLSLHSNAAGGEEPIAAAGHLPALIPQLNVLEHDKDNKLTSLVVNQNQVDKRPLAPPPANNDNQQEVNEMVDQVDAPLGKDEQMRLEKHKVEALNNDHKEDQLPDNVNVEYGRNKSL